MQGVKNSKYELGHSPKDLKILNIVTQGCRYRFFKKEFLFKRKQ